MTRSRATDGAVLSLLLLAALGPLTACSGTGSVSLPTSLPSARESSAAASPSATPTAAAPSGAALPSIEPSSGRLPTLTLPTSPTEPTPTQSPAVTPTVTQTDTQTRTLTSTVTVTQTAPAGAVPTAAPSKNPSAAPTETPSPAAADGAAPPKAAAAATSDAGTVWWPWVLLALVVLGGLGWWLLRRGQQQAVVDAWDRRLEVCEDEASWVEDSLTAQVLARASTAEAQTIWVAAQPRLLQIDEDLHSLTGDAPDEARSTRATKVRALVRELVEAVGSDLTAEPATEVATGPDQFRARRAAIDSARQRLRAALGPVHPNAGPVDGMPAEAGR